MSAYLDKSQGVTFVFSNIYQIYQKAKNAKLDDPMIVERGSSLRSQVIKEYQKQESAATSPVVKEFKPKDLERSFSVPMGVKEAEAKALKLQSESVSSIKQNLDSLKDAHAKLRYLLKELEQISKK